MSFAGEATMALTLSDISARTRRQPAELTRRDVASALLTVPAATAMETLPRLRRELLAAGVDLAGRLGQVVGLIGPNGSGKTTLLRMLYGAVRPRTGLVTLDDGPLDRLGSRELARRVSVVAQEAAPELPITVGEMVLLGRSPHRSSFQRYTPKDDRAAAQALRGVGPRHLADRPYMTLSGGEKQRVLIAQQSDHLLVDEPTNHLDIRYQHEVLPPSPRDHLKGLRMVTPAIR